MKKILLLIAIFATVSLTFAQFQIGPKFGVNFSKQKASDMGDNPFTPNMVTDFNADVRNKTGASIGLMMNIAGNHVFNFQPEFMYVSRGYVSVDSLNNSSRQVNKYLDVNLLFNLGKTTENWRVYGIFGPSLDFWLSKATYDKDGKFIDKSDEFDNNTNFFGITVTDFPVDFSFIIGAGFKYKLGPGWLCLSPRYQIGFIPQTLYDFGNDDYLTYSNKRGIYLDFSYAFQFGGE